MLWLKYNNLVNNNQYHYYTNFIFFKIHLVQYLIITCPPSPSYQTYHNCLYWTLRFHHIYIVINLYAVNPCVNLYYF